MIGCAVRLYAPSLVLIVWASVWALGVRGSAVVVAGLLLTALAVVVHANEWRENHAGT